MKILKYSSLVFGALILIFGLTFFIRFSRYNYLLAQVGIDDPTLTLDDRKEIYEIHHKKLGIQFSVK